MADDDFDEILKSLGSGWWTWVHMSGLSCVLFMIPSLVLAGGFVVPSSDFNCSSQEAASTSMNQTQDQCFYKTFENTTTGEEGEVIQKCSAWTYDTSEFEETLTSEFNLVCDDAYLRPTYQTVYMLGNFVGSALFGFLADKFGRKLLMVYSSLLSIASILLSTFSTNFAAILFFRFINGVTSHPGTQSGYILCMEIFDPKHRATLGLLLSVPWGLGVIWWGLLGYAIRDWRWLIRATTIPGIISCVFYGLMDESPRWLIVNGFHGKALKILKKASRWNHSSLPADQVLLERMVRIQKLTINECESDEKPKKELTFVEKSKGAIQSLTILYRTPEIRKKTLLMYVVFVIASAVYFGLSLNAVNFNVDPFMYVIISGVTEVIGFTAVVPVVAAFGRTRPTALYYLVSGLTIFVVTFIPDPKWFVMTLAMIGKFGISSAYQIIFLISSEIFPTEVRMQGLGTACFFSTIGGFSAPFITDLVGNIHRWIPSVIFGALSTLAAVTTMFIPETQNKTLPETVLQVELEAQNRRKHRRQNEEEALSIRLTQKPV